MSFIEGVDKYSTIAVRFFKLHFTQFENFKMSNKIWLRAETKPAEARSARTYKRIIDLTPLLILWKIYGN